MLHFMPKVTNPGIYLVQNHLRNDLGKKLYATILLRGKNGLYRTTFFIDTGSDLTLMQESRAKRIFSEKFIKNNAITVKSQLLSYTSEQILIKYKLQVTAYFTHTGFPNKLTLNVIQDLSGVPHIILGSDTIRAFQGTISYKEKPLLTMHYPTLSLLETYFLTDEELYTISTTVILGPGESRTERLVLPPHCTAVPGDSLCTEWTKTANLEALPSRSKVIRGENSNKGYCLVFITNKSNKEIRERMLLTYYLLEDENCIPITKENIHSLSNTPLWTPCLEKTSANDGGNIIVIQETPIDHEMPIKQSLYNIQALGKNSKEDSIDLNYKDKFDESDDLDPDILVPRGYEVPNTDLSASDIVKLENFPESHREYIKDIFLDNFPNIISKNSMQCGDISRTLGFYTIHLKPNVILPNHRRIFNLSPADRQHLSDILAFMEKYNIIERSPISSQNKFDNVVGVPSFLVPRAREGVPARLVLDYSRLNRLLLTEQSAIPGINTLLHSLKGYSIFSCIDVANAYNSFSIDPECRHISTFSTALGLYQMTKIPTGMSVSSGIWQKIIDKILHCDIAQDENGENIYLKDNTVKLVESPLPGTFSYFDDIIIGTRAQNTYKESLNAHFQLVKKVCQRLSNHNVLIGFEKVNLGKNTIKFLGHIISNDFLIPDNRRIQKLLDAKMPHTRKGFRSFLGLANSIRNSLDADFMREIYTLTPLTGGNTELKITDKHRLAFQNLKKYLTTKPLFNNLICPNSPKFLFTDASSSADGYYSAVLCQQVTNLQSNPHHHSLCLDSPVDQLIFDHGFKFIPIPPLSDLHNPSTTQKEINKTRPPYSEYLEQKYLGYTENTYSQSLFISSQIIMSVSKCKIIDIKDMRRGLAKVIKKSEICLNLETFVFNNIKSDFNQFMSNLEGDGEIDKCLYVADALARFLHRQFIIISSLKEHKAEPVIRLNTKLDSKPSFIFGLFLSQEGKQIFRPYRELIDTSYDISKDSNSFQIIAYHTKSLPKTKTALHIMEHELFAVLSSLNSLKSFIGQAPLTLITDSKSLFLLFNKQVHNSSVKICRYSLKLHCDYPLLKVLFTKSETNISDFLSKHFEVNIEDINRIALKQFKVKNLDDIIPDKAVSLTTWKNIVNTNPHKLELIGDDGVIRRMESSVDRVEMPEEAPSTSSINTLTKQSALEKQVNVIKLLEGKLSYDNIVLEQRREFPAYIKACTLEKNQELITSDRLSLLMKYGLLYANFPTGPKIFLPNSLISTLLAYYHLSTGHGGIKRLTLAVTNFYFRRKTELIYEITSKCLPCSLVNTSTRPHPIGSYPVPPYPFHTIFCDLAENLNAKGGYSHLLIVVDPVSDGTLIFPLKTKTSHEVYSIFFTAIYQQYQTRVIISDNGACFQHKLYLKQLALLGIHKVKSSSLNPKARGLVERKVGLVKNLMKKYLVGEDEYDWRNLHLIIGKLINSSICSKTGMEPYSLIFGHSAPPFGEGIVKIHPLIDTYAPSIQQNNETLRRKTEIIRQQIRKEQEKRNQRLNKHRFSSKNFIEGQLAFVKDRTVIDGSTRPLKSLFSASPYVVERILKTTICVKRLCDNFVQVFSKDDVKPLHKLNGLFNDLPKTVLDILAQNIKIENLLPKQIKILQTTSPVDFPGGIAIDNDEEIELPLLDDLVDVDDDFFETSDMPEPEVVDTTTKRHKNPILEDSSKANSQPPVTVVNKDSGISKYNLRPKKPSIVERLRMKSSSNKKKVKFQQD